MRNYLQSAPSDTPGGPTSRRGFLGRTAAASAAVTGAMVAGAGRAFGAGPTALATSSNGLPETTPGANRVYFNEIRNDENSHVSYIASTLGSAARPKPTFQNLTAPNLKTFVSMSAAFENTGAGAYVGAAPSINGVVYLSAATRIALIEGRHASWLQTLVFQTLAPGPVAFETPLTQQEVVSRILPYIASLNGGPPAGFDLARSDANDVNIFNFALILEYLEAEFYNINVPRFFP